MSIKGLDSVRDIVLYNYPQIREYQVFIMSDKSAYTIPYVQVHKNDRLILDQIALQSMNKFHKINTDYSFMLRPDRGADCYAYTYMIPDFNKKLLILMYLNKKSPIPEEIKTMNDTLTLFVFLRELAMGHKGIFEVLQESLWESPYAVCITNPLGDVEFGNGALYQLFHGDVPNIMSIIDKKIFLLLLDGEKVGQTFSLQGRRIRVEAFPISNKNFLITKCLFVFYDSKVEATRELLGDAHTLKRFTSGSAVVGAAMFTTEGVILYSNEAFMKSLDIYKVREASQKTIFDLFDLSEDVYSVLVDTVLSGMEYRGTITNRENNEEFQVLFKGIVFGDKTIIEVVLEDNTMYHEHMSYLDKETQKLYEELNTACSIQEHILTLPTIYRPGIYVNTFYKPAHQLSGDFYTITPIKDDKMSILIADVSGHGISASLITAALKILIEFVPTDSGSIPKIMAYFNTYLAGILPEGSFVTLFYGVIDLKENTLQYINSGHTFPILEDLDKNETKIIEGMGYPLGGLLNISFEELVYTIQLPDKYRILLYTDGILQHLSGTIKDKLNEIRKFMANHKIVNDKILENLYHFITSRNSSLPEDDISLMSLSVDRHRVNRHHLQISSSLLEVDTVSQEIGGYIKETAKLSQSLYWKLYTCLYEALLNAVVHGNKYNTQKKVYIEFRIFTDVIAIRIRDEGTGFDYENLPDPFDPENILEDFGRGIKMIRSIADKTKFNESGTEITMFFRLVKKD